MKINNKIFAVIILSILFTGCERGWLREILGWNEEEVEEYNYSNHILYLSDESWDGDPYYYTGNDIYIMDIEGNNRRNLTQLNYGNDIEHFTISPDGLSLHFFTGIDMGWESYSTYLYNIGFDGGNPSEYWVRLYQDPQYNFMEPVYSTNGNILAVSAQQTRYCPQQDNFGVQRLWVIVVPELKAYELNSSGWHQPPGLGSVYDFCGKKLVYVEVSCLDPYATEGLIVQDFENYIEYRSWEDGTRPYDVLTNSLFPDSLIWTAINSLQCSPDGEKIVFSNDGNLWIVDVNGSNLYELPSFSGAQVEGFSLDGSMILYTHTTTDSVTNIAVINIDGNNNMSITYDDYNNINPTISLDGTTIVFSTNRPSSSDYNIFRIDINGQNEKQLTYENSHDYKPLLIP